MLVRSQYNKNQNLYETIRKLIKILKVLNKRSLYGLVLLLFYMLIGTFVELIYLVCISQFTNYLFINDATLSQASNNPLAVNNFYSELILFINNYTSSELTANGIAIIVVSIITLSVRLYILRNNLKETAKIAGVIESNCGEKLANIKYDYIKNLKVPDVITNYNRIPGFINSIIQQGLLAISSIIVILFIVFYLNSQTYNLFIIAFFILALIYALILILSSRKNEIYQLSNQGIYFYRTASLTYMVQMFRQMLIEQKKYICQKIFATI